MEGRTLIIRIRLPEGDQWETTEAAKHALEAVIAINLGIMRRMKLPLLYKSGVRYKPEPNNGYEDFDNALVVLARKNGDCDDLVAWRIAELRKMGENAQVRIVWPRGSRRYHAQVRRADGTVEDPSRVLNRHRKGKPR